MKGNVYEKYSDLMTHLSILYCKINSIDEVCMDIAKELTAKMLIAPSSIKTINVMCARMLP